MSTFLLVLGIQSDSSASLFLLLKQRRTMRVMRTIKMATRKRRKTLRAVPTPMPTALFRGGVIGADAVAWVVPACTRGGREGLARGRRMHGGKQSMWY